MIEPHSIGVAVDENSAFGVLEFVGAKVVCFKAVV